jgi:hypothetical protein
VHTSGADLDEVLQQAEEWAREHVHYLTGAWSGKNKAVWIAQIKADGQLFERRVSGKIVERDTLRARAANDAIADYLDWVRRRYLEDHL